MHKEVTMIEIQTQFIADDKIRHNQHKKMGSDQGHITTAYGSIQR